MRGVNDTLEKSKVENDNFNITFKPDTIIMNNSRNFAIPEDGNQINIFNENEGSIPETIREHNPETPRQNAQKNNNF